MGDELKHVTIYTDGYAVPDPGVGGYGVVIRFGEHRKELSGGFQRTTNNRMELMAAIFGLEALKERCRITLHSDSQDIVKAIAAGLALRWKHNGWAMTPRGSKRVMNTDLWGRLLAVVERHEVTMVRVKGHTGIDDNERCEVMAMEASRQPGLPVDSGFEESTPPETVDRSLAKARQRRRSRKPPPLSSKSIRDLQAIDSEADSARQQSRQEHPTNTNPDRRRVIPITEQDRSAHSELKRLVSLGRLTSTLAVMLANRPCSKLTSVQIVQVRALLLDAKQPAPAPTPPKDDRNHKDYSHMGPDLTMWGDGPHPGLSSDAAWKENRARQKYDGG